MDLRSPGVAHREFDLASRHCTDRTKARSKREISPLQTLIGPTQKPEEPDFPYPAIYAGLGWLLAQGGEHDAAIARLAQGVAISHSVGVREESSHLLASLAETELARGRAKEGLAAIEEARAFVEETGERFWEAEIHRLEGELQRLDGRETSAEVCFKEALELARAQGALSLELRAATSLTRLYNDTGRGQEARPLLADVYGRFSEGFDTADLRDAHTLLDSL